MAILLSTALHFMILYVEFFGSIFATDPLDLNDWCLVLLVSLPVILLDEFVKIFARASTRRRLKLRLAESKRKRL